MDKKKLAIMQPYFFPYIGYFQLISAVDTFVIYDNIEFTKKGWINRNRILRDGEEVMFSLPLKRDSDYLHIRDRKLSSDFNRSKLLNQLKGAYLKAPFFALTFPVIEHILQYEDANLFHYLHHSLVRVCEYLGIATEIKISSDIKIDHTLHSQDKVLALCVANGSKIYINAIGGMGLYSQNDFKRNNIDLKFIKSNKFEYSQFGRSFVPWLSIIDVMMFNSVDDIKNNILDNYELLV